MEGPGWDQVEADTREGLAELASMVLIPGSVGAAPIQNIGAYGSELADPLVQVHVFDRQRNEVCWLSASECEFGYRSSRFKRESHMIHALRT